MEFTLIHGGKLTIDELLSKNVILDITAQSSKVGFLYPVYLTRRLYDMLEASEEEKLFGQTQTSRVFNLLTTLLFRIRQHDREKKGQEALISYETRIATSDGHIDIPIKAICKMTDEGSPAIFIMSITEHI